MKTVLNSGYANTCLAHFLFPGICCFEGPKIHLKTGVKRDTSDSYLILRGFSAVKVDATRRVASECQEPVSKRRSVSPWRPEF
jgi:hypothetical protein